jgi:hypothetical protein
MDAKHIIDRIGDSQNWNDDSKVNLLCRYIDYLETCIEGAAPYKGCRPSAALPLGAWLDNQVRWEETEGLDAGRPS